MEDKVVSTPHLQALEEALLRECWQQWAGVIESLARGKPARMEERDYHWLHASLVNVCKKRGSNKFCERLETLIAPWMSLYTLAATDRETLASLSSRCREINRQLGLATSARFWLAAALVFVIAGVAGILLSQATGIARSLPSWASAWRYLQDNPLVAVAGAAPLAVLATFLGVGRFFRN